MRTRAIIILSLLLISCSSFSQGLVNPYGNTRGAGWLSGRLPDNARFNLELGTSFSSFGAGAGLLRNYVSPVLQYDFSPSFAIITGGTFSSNHYNNLPQSVVVHGNTMPGVQPLNDYSLFMTGVYRLSDNFYMTGTVYRDQGNLPIMMQSTGMTWLNRGLGSYTNEGMSMGFGYRVSEKFRFGAEIGVNRTNNPYSIYSPFSDPFNSRQYRSRHHFSPY